MVLGGLLGVSYAWCAFGFLGFVVWLGLDCLGLVWGLGFGIAWWRCLGSFNASVVWFIVEFLFGYGYLE